MHRISDCEIIAFIEKTEHFYPADANLASTHENRRFYDAMCAAFLCPRPATVTVEDSYISHVPIRIYQPQSESLASSENALDRPIILYAHGGGLVVGGLDSHDDICAEIADQCALTTIAFDYRLAPEHPFPAQLDDMETVYDGLVKKSAPVITMGDSAGGHLCAGLALRLRRQGKPMPKAQILIYPGLGGDLSLPSYHENAEAPLLRTKDLLAYRTSAEAENTLNEIQREEAAPLMAADFSQLPPAYVFTADIDPLRDDGKLYVERLNAAGIKAIWHNDAQLVHGYLRGRHMSQRIGNAFRAICNTLKMAASV